MNIKLSISIILIVITSYLSAQESNTLKFGSFTTEDGLPDNYCEAILQDSYGFIWIGTNDGLCRYDGFNFKVYQNIANDTTSLLNNTIMSLFEDSRKNIWVGTNMGGLAKYNRENDNFKRYVFTPPDSSSYQLNRVNEFVETSNHIWFATMNGFARLNPETEQVKWFSPPPFKNKSLNPKQIIHIYADKNENLWLGTLYGGLYYFNTSTEKFEKHYTHDKNDQKSISNDKLKHIYEDREGKIWIATEEGGINVLDKNTETFKHYIHKPGDNGSIGVNDVKYFYEDSQGFFWIGTINGGLYSFDRKTEKFIRLGVSDISPYKMDAQSVIRIMEDSFGNIWFTTHGSGVVYFNPKINRFKHLKTPVIKHTEFANDYVAAFYEDGDRKIWIGIDGGGLYKFDPRNYTFEDTELSSKNKTISVLDIIKADNNKIWLATWGEGILLFDTKSNTVIKKHLHHPTQNSLGINDIKGLILDSNNLWIASHGDGLNILNLETEKFTNWRFNNYYNFDMHLPEWSNQIFKDHKNRFWIATVSGLFYVKGKEIKSFYDVKNDSSAVGGFIISCIFQDKQNKIWIGSERGLSLFNEETETFTNYTEKYDLPVKIKSIEEDNKGNFWLSTNSGIYCFNHHTKKISSYDKNDGLQGNQFIERSSIKLSSGHMLFGGLNGFNMFHPDSIKEIRTIPKVYFTDFQIFNKSQYPKDAGSVLSKNILLTDTITIDYSQSVICFEYVGLAYGSQHKTKYSILLDGFDENWRNVGTERKSTYTNLDPGKYIFKVKASNDKNIWSKEKTIVLIVLPPWWKTWWFKTLAVLCILFSIFSYYQVRLRNINLLNKKLEKEVKKQTADLLEANTNLQEFQQEIMTKNEELAERNKELSALNQTKDKFFSIIAHDLKSPVSVIMGFSKLLVTRKDTLAKDKRESFAEYIYESSRKVSDLIINLLEWARSQTGALKYSPLKHNITDIIEANTELVKTLARNKNIEIETEIEIEKKVFCDDNMLNTILRNLLINAIKFTPENGNVFVMAKEFNDYHKISIIDTGIGISDEKKQKIMNSETVESTRGTADEAGSGLGLMLCKDFIDKHGGQFIIQKLEGGGSEFSFTLPK